LGILFFYFGKDLNKKYDEIFPIYDND